MPGSMLKQPIEFMFSRYRHRALATLFLHPKEPFHVRELERMTEIHASSLHRKLECGKSAVFGQGNTAARTRPARYGAEKVFCFVEK